MHRVLNKTWGIVISIMVLFTACYEETATPVKASFSTSFVGADESVPVQVSITNQSTGADTFEWMFEGAEPISSTEENPGTIIYNTAGTYTIVLTASNVDGSTHTYQKEIPVVDGIAINFSTEIIESNYLPVEVILTNNTNGVGLTYNWTFEDGAPVTSTEQHPSNVIFETPGNHLITLEVYNGFESFSESTTINVAPDIEAIFDWKVDFFDDDYQAPVTITMTNSSISATSYTWTFPNGTPATSTNKIPTVTFNMPGTHAMSLKADNGKRTNTLTHDITILPDTNLRTFSDIELGVNTAHNSNVIGAFLSTTLREVFQAGEVTTDNGAEIDIAFFGLNSSFSFNKFIAPDEVATNGFIAIPDATHTKFINSQEICGCAASLTVAQFDSITDDTLLDTLTITETANGLLNFDNSVLPRVVLLETADGRKGAIKIKGYVDDGLNSYIICDIKIQKQ
ncbi:PKD domain-containing protein [Tamlana sp. 2201CG12-4]|uniref:PKD domain-containing protein n=1 Tax=Tamlana sp. 2201CG12-4 TaxID=3112582 RepID=UPI002DBCF884|nr:PKD domain-containing protein [Tamlana sp. 2201CG12-4]MEC3908205.1 PKD domain-containing protein [Tamlana sp. 2201CG12-4]